MMTETVPNSNSYTQAQKNRVLIVDEEALYSDSLATRLEHNGFLVEQAKTALETTSHLENGNWNLIVTAWRLGNSHGLDLLRQFQSCKCPLLLWSDDPQIQEQSKQWPQLGVSKAFTRMQRSDLLEKVKKLTTTPAVFDDLTLNKIPPSTPTFLLVEDSPVIRQYLKRVLDDTWPACDIHEAEDGRSALTVMKSNRISLIITDLQMPGMDGESFVQLLTKNPVLKKKPVIIFSGMITQRLRDDMKERSSLKLLSKPAEPHVVTKAVKDLLQ